MPSFLPSLSNPSLLPLLVSHHLFPGIPPLPSGWPFSLPRSPLSLLYFSLLISLSLPFPFSRDYFSRFCCCTGVCSLILNVCPEALTIPKPVLSKLRAAVVPGPAA